MYCKLLSEEIALSRFGGKAHNLAVLMRLNVTVPKGFAISKLALQAFKKDGQWPSDAMQEVKTHIGLLKTEKVIVRSSAIGEDSKLHSFAGQLDSIVTDNDVYAVINAIELCWKGLENDRLKAYMDMAKVDVKDMGVIVQSFIEPDFAGVTFTSAPQAEVGMYTEYVPGRGEQLVSGAVTPNVYLHALDVSSSSDLPFDLRRLEQVSSELKEYYGFDLDIEWLSKDDRLYFVQARPITVTKSKVYWTNTNLNENYPDPISPLLYSIARDSYYHYFKNLAGLLQIDHASTRSLEYDFSNAVGIWGNRIYYNMTSIHNILSSSPLRSYFIDAFNKFVGYEDVDVTTDDRSKATSVFRLVWRLIRLNFKMDGYVQEIEQMVSAYSDRSKKGEADNLLFYEFLDLRFNQWYRASVADFFAMIHYKLLSKITQRFYGSEAVGVHNKLVQAIPNLISTKPLFEIYEISKAIEEVPDGRVEFLTTDAKILLDEVQNKEKWEKVNTMVGAYLEKWGFRCSGELMFLSSNYIEDPSKFIVLLKSYLKQDTSDPRVSIAQKARERKQALRRCVWKIVKKRHVFFPLSFLEIMALLLISKHCKKAIASRERVRYRQAEMYFRFKQTVKRIGGTDMFFLTYKEIGELLSSSFIFDPVLSENLEQRKQAFEANTATFPEHFSTNFGEKPKSVVGKIELDFNARIFSGLAASGGQVKARVVVLKSVLEGDKIQRGDILVTQQTDPGWAMVFPLISGLIVERGGALSHGAIVAREFGIPAVVGVNGISEILKDGDEVILDGDLGKIQLL